MTVSEMMALLTDAQDDGRLLLRDSNGDGRLRVVKSVSIRIDDDGGIFVVLHNDRARDMPDVVANTEG